MNKPLIHYCFMTSFTDRPKTKSPRKYHITREKKWDRGFKDSCDVTCEQPPTTQLHQQQTFQEFPSNPIKSCFKVHQEFTKDHNRIKSFSPFFLIPKLRSLILNVGGINSFTVNYYFKLPNFAFIKFCFY